MRFQSSSILIAASLLASGASARFRTEKPDDSGPVHQRSHLTAFVVTDEGLKLECWEMIPNRPQNMRSSRHRDTVQLTHMDVGEGELVGVDILTWPSPTLIYPPPTRDSYTLGGSNHMSALMVKDGLILVESQVAASKSDKTFETSVFSMENGDDWFYFEDSYTANSLHTKDSSPIRISTESGGPTTLVSFQYDETPQHKVLHEGRCSFAGLKAPKDSGKNDKDIAMIRLTVEDY